MRAATTNPANVKGTWDHLGVGASALCAVHCLIAPVLVLALPTAGEVWAHPASHALIALAVLPLAVTILRHGYRVHRKRWIAVAAIAGMSFVFVGSALPYVNAGSSPAGGAESSCTSCCPSVVADESGDQRVHLPPASIATLFGSFFLISCHVGNFRGCRRECCLPGSQTGSMTSSGKNPDSFSMEPIAPGGAGPQRAHMAALSRKRRTDNEPTSSR